MASIYAFATQAAWINMQPKSHSRQRTVHTKITYTRHIPRLYTHNRQTACEVGDSFQYNQNCDVTRNCDVLMRPEFHLTERRRMTFEMCRHQWGAKRAISRGTITAVLRHSICASPLCAGFETSNAGQPGISRLSFRLSFFFYFVILWSALFLYRARTMFQALVLIRGPTNASQWPHTLPYGYDL